MKENFCKNTCKSYSIRCLTRVCKSPVFHNPIALAIFWPPFFFDSVSLFLAPTIFFHNKTKGLMIIKRSHIILCTFLINRPLLYVSYQREQEKMKIEVIYHGKKISKDSIFISSTVYGLYQLNINAFYRPLCNCWICLNRNERLWTAYLYLPNQYFSCYLSFSNNSWEIFFYLTCTDALIVWV